MGQNRVRVKAGKAARWGKGQSSNSNPAKTKHRSAAKGRYFQNQSRNAGFEGNSSAKIYIKVSFLHLNNLLKISGINSIYYNYILIERSYSKYLKKNNKGSYICENSTFIIFVQCFGSGSGWIRTIWPDPLQETLIRIRVAKENRDKQYKIQTNYKNIIFFERNHFLCLIYVNNKLKLQKKHRYEFYKFTEKKMEFGRWLESAPDPEPDPDQLSWNRIRGTGSASK